MKKKQPKKPCQNSYKKEAKMYIYVKIDETESS